MFCSLWYLNSMIYSSPLASVDEFAHLCGLWWKVTNQLHLTLVNGDCIIYQNLRTSKWWINNDWTWSISHKRSIKKEAFGKWYFDLPSVVMTSFSGVVRLECEASVWWCWQPSSMGRQKVWMQLVHVVCLVVAFVIALIPTTSFKKHHV